jgi:hypothetical protein
MQEMSDAHCNRQQRVHEYLASGSISNQDQENVVEPSSPRYIRQPGVLLRLVPTNASEDHEDDPVHRNNIIAHQVVAPSIHAQRAEAAPLTLDGAKEAIVRALTTSRQNQFDASSVEIRIVAGAERVPLFTPSAHFGYKHPMTVTIRDSIDYELKDTADVMSIYNSGVCGDNGIAKEIIDRIPVNDIAQVVGEIVIANPATEGLYNAYCGVANHRAATRVQLLLPGADENRVLERSVLYIELNNYTTPVPKIEAVRYPSTLMDNTPLYDVSCSAEVSSINHPDRHSCGYVHAKKGRLTRIADSLAWTAMNIAPFVFVGTMLISGVSIGMSLSRINRNLGTLATRHY